MGTRCNIILKQGENLINIYRHWDGYLAVTGYDLTCRLQHSFSKNGFTKFDVFLKSILGAKREANTLDIEKDLYELTTGLHGDTEYLYKFEFFSDWDSKRVDVTIKKRYYGSQPNISGWEDVAHEKVNQVTLWPKLNLISEAHLKYLKAA